MSHFCRWRPPFAGQSFESKSQFAGQHLESKSAQTRDDGLRRTCRKKTNLAFIKVHKAGGTTMCQLFFRFGLHHRLNFVLPNASSHTTAFNLGWPRPLKKRQYLRRIDGEPFNILTNHAVYRRDVFRNIMPNDTAYLAILREPFSHLKSAMNFYRLRRKFHLPKNNTIPAFLQQPSLYDKHGTGGRRTHPYSYTNLMSFDMGIKFSARLDTEYVKSYVTRLEREFRLVLILEYLDESLVLLKRYMCWDIEDILYKPKIHPGSGMSHFCRWRPPFAGQSFESKSQFAGQHLESKSAQTRDDGLRRTCRKKTNLAFIKVHKAGGTTMCQLFFRFGLRHHLNFVLPNASSHTTAFNLGWPRPLKKRQYLRRIDGEPFNILTNHAVYRRDVFRNIMPNDTAYLAILREPFSHLKSAMNFYRLRRKFHLPKNNTIPAFLQQPSLYDKHGTGGRRTHPYSYTNLMSFDMGIKFSARLDTEYVKSYVTRLEREFRLVLILEYLDESLVLLKRYMCWDIEDILYKPKIHPGRSVQG
uniref:Galactose-3-O-sulfotransferase 3 n=1 Tax=Branchiostoma floridae TaxID=7739 RepID=C3XV60_BRAFL|eukprot:XP_002611977.1 hypothetical protein BRAFLDRAFT_91863 [Branchiostoma floridae]